MTFRITAQDLQNWSSEREARYLLPVLVRRLIRETQRPESIMHMNFPGYENVDRSGPDGILKTSASNNQYVPAGKSVWEFSTSADISQKATHDIKKREKIASNKMVFVFVSSRNWKQKEKWLNDISSSKWKKLLAYDANDLEQWLEFSPCTSLWISEQIGKPHNYLATTDTFLNRWLQETKPEFPVDILLEGRDAQTEKLREFLDSKQPETDFSVVADTRDEAVAFISAVIEKIDTKNHPIIIVKHKEGIREATRWLAEQHEVPKILVAQSMDIAREIPHELLTKNILVIARVREDYDNAEPNKSITLTRVRSFDKIFQHNHVKDRTYYQQTGGSLSVLHRMLNENTAKREPKWIKAANKDKKIIWLALIGRWDEQCDGDKEYIRKLAKLNKYQDWEEYARNLTNEEGTPLERTSGRDRCYRLFSRLDTFYAVARQIEANDIEAFLDSATLVLQEKDPNYRPPSDNMVIQIRQPRRYSDTIRLGIVEGITILNLSKENLTCGDISNKISEFYDAIFMPDKAWHSLRDVLPQLAEASPDDFIRKLDNALEHRLEEIRDLFTARSNIFGCSYEHPHLMWALELLAWNPDWFRSVLQLFCKLQKMFEEKIENYGNKPSTSMHDIMRSWMAQTAATIKQREEALDGLYQKYPWEIAQLALGLANTRDTTGEYTRMPVWRDDALKTSRPTEKERIRIIKKSIKIISQFIGDNNQNPERRAQAAEKIMHNFGFWDNDSSVKVSGIICSMPKDNVDIASKLHEYARTLLARRERQKNRSTTGTEESIQFFKAIVDHFQPDDLIEEKAFLFSTKYMMEVLTKRDLKHEEGHKIVDNTRDEALQIIYKKYGIGGIIKLVGLAEQPETVSQVLYIKHIASGDFPLEEYLTELLKSDIDIRKINCHLCNLLGWDKKNPIAMRAAKAINIVDNMIEHINKNNKIDKLEEKKVLLYHAIRIDEQEGRNYIDSLPEETQKQYFSVHRFARRMECWKDSDSSEYPAENEWLAKKYIKYKRPRLGWNVFTFPTHIPFEWQLELLDAMYVIGRDEGKDKDPAPDSHYVQEFFNYALKKELNYDQEKRLAMVEFKLYRMLDTYDTDRASVVQQHIGNNPEFFMELMCYAYKTDNGHETSKPESEQESEQIRASIAHDILFHLNLISDNYPWIQSGILDETRIKKWTEDVRELAKKANRSRITDHIIGVGLSHGFVDQHMVLPKPAICSIIETIQNDAIASGFSMGRRNSRGALIGGVDRKGYTSSRLAEEYDKASIKMRDDDYPFMSEIMRELATDYRREAEFYKGQEERTDLDWR